MDTIFINYKNSKTSDPHRLLLNVPEKINLKKSDKYVALSNLSISYTWKNIKNWYKNNVGSYSLSDIQDYFEYVFHKHRETTDNPPIRIYVNRIKNRITFKIKKGYSLKLLTPKTMKLLGSNKFKITKDKNGENVPNLEITKVVLVHCNTDFQQDSRVLYTIISSQEFVILKTFNSEFSYIEVCFTDQNSRPLEREDKINIPSVIN